MDMLKQALQSKLPFVHVTTDDTINVAEVLSYIAGEEVKGIDVTKLVEGPMGLMFPEGDIFYTNNSEVALPKLYLTCKDAGKCLVFVNTKTSVLHFNGGVMYPPQELMKEYLSSLLDSEEEAVGVLPAYGGLTLKDMFEVTKITATRTGAVSCREVNETRQGYITKLRGITQIDTKFDFYQVPSYLGNWMEENLLFFKKPINPSLTPRGLLFDGPPGTGKTMAAKYLATTLGVPLYHLDIGGMKGKYVGDSEGNLHAALSQVDQVEPCVVLFDEVEKIFCEQSDSGVTSSLLSTILWWLQEHKSKVFTVMTTNKKSSIPPELYREGRIDETMVFMGLETHKQAMDFASKVFEALAKTIWSEPVEPDFKELTKKIKMLFSEGGCVPQVRVTKEVHHVIKQMLIKEG